MALPQPLHIARKDLLHLWPETLVAVLLFVAFAWAAPSGWTNSQYAGVATLLAGFLRIFLMPLSWLVVISRLVHDESLVGDRQFWTSRPYHWLNLLAAKIIYIIGFLYIPFLIMQVYLLKHAGLYPTTAIPGLLHNLLLLTVVIVVPLTAIAAVTGTFARMLLSTIGAVIYIIVIALGLLYLIFQRMPPPGFDYVMYTLIIVLPAAVVVYQYATRNTPVSRILLIATPLLVALLLLVTPASAIIRNNYKPVSSDDPKLGQLPDQLMPKSADGKLITRAGNNEVEIPLTTTGGDEKSNYTVQGVQATIDGGGVHYVTPYLSEVRVEINSFRPGTFVPVQLPAAIFNKIHSTPVDIHLSLAAEHLKLQDASTWHAGALPFSVPGHGLCSFATDFPGDPATCRFAFSSDISFVSAKLSQPGTCGVASAPQNVRQMNLVAGPATLDFDPVVIAPLSFQSPMRQGPPERLVLCPGAALDFQQVKTLSKVRFDVDLKGIVLDPLASRIPDAEVPNNLRQQP